MKVLFAVWELDPLIKVGGLGDVARSLPVALRIIGVDVRVVIPFYKALKLGKSKKTKVADIQFDYAGKKETVEIFHLFHPENKFPVYLLSHKRFLSIPHFPDTFAFFDKAVVCISQGILSWKPDIIHCNDLHTGLIPLLVREGKLPIKTLLTIHNLAYQGATSIDILEKLGIKESKGRIIKWEIASKRVNFLLEGIVHADSVTTVSPTYAKEIMTEEFGVGLEEILRGKEGRVFGILNGIDNAWRQIWKIKHVKYHYMSGVFQEGKFPGRVYSWEEGKRLNKIYLQKKLGLKTDGNIPMLGFIGRFDPRQKGIDILHKMLRRDGFKRYQLVILGKGKQDWEERFQWLNTFYPKSISCTFTFDEALANQIYAASDFMLIPSRFEPCGLVQMIAMYFGTLPVAHKTGGLIDSIKDGYNGFLFGSYSAEALTKAVKRALDIWRRHKSLYRKMVENALSTDFSWEKSAGKYLEIYIKLLKNNI